MGIRLKGQTSGYVEIKAPATAADNTLTFPNGNGSNNQVLTTDGSGGLTFAAPQLQQIQRPSWVVILMSTAMTSLPPAMAILIWTQMVLVKLFLRAMRLAVLAKSN